MNIETAYGNPSKAYIKGEPIDGTIDTSKKERRKVEPPNLISRFIDEAQNEDVTATSLGCCCCWTTLVFFCSMVFACVCAPFCFISDCFTSKQKQS